MVRGKVSNKTRKSASSRAGLTFPMARVKRQMKAMVGKKMRVTWMAAGYCTAVLEYLSAEILEISGNVSRSLKTKRLNPRHIKLAVAHDEEMNNLLKKVTIPGGGVVPMILPALLPRSSKSTGKTVPYNPPSPKPKKVVAVKVAPKGRAALKIGKATTKATPVSKGKVGVKSSGVTVLGQRILAGGQKLSVVNADIVDVKCDVIVNPSSGDYSLGGQVGNRLRAVGGTAFVNKIEYHKKKMGKWLASCTAAISDGVNFSAPLVMHCNGPTWSDMQTSIPLLQSTVTNCLATADNRKLTSICFPSIGSGVGNFPKQTAAQTILKSISDYFKTNSSLTTITEVYFTLYDQESIDVYVTELGRLQE